MAASLKQFRVLHDTRVGGAHARFRLIGVGCEVEEARNSAQSEAGAIMVAYADVDSANIKMCPVHSSLILLLTFILTNY